MNSKHMFLSVCVLAFNAYCDPESPSELTELDEQITDEPAAIDDEADFDLVTPPEAPVKATPLTGVVSDAAFITVPSGKVSNWSLLVSPNLMGVEEIGGEKDNALLKLDCHVTVINDYTWQVTARSKYRYWSTKDGVWKAGKANYILVPR